MGKNQHFKIRNKNAKEEKAKDDEWAKGISGGCGEGGQKPQGLVLGPKTHLNISLFSIPC